MICNLYACIHVIFFEEYHLMNINIEFNYFIIFTKTLETSTFSDSHYIYSSVKSITIYTRMGPNSYFAFIAFLNQDFNQDKGQNK